MRTFSSLKEMKPYFNAITNSYEFFENGKLLDIEITFGLTINGNILARDINALDINAYDITAGDIDALSITAGDISSLNIKAWDINAGDIEATEISFHAVCFAYKNIVCKSIKGRRANSRYFALDGEVIIKEEK